MSKQRYLPFVQPTQRSIRDLPPGERPHYRIQQVGCSGLSDRELLTLLFNSRTALQTSTTLLDRHGSLHQLARTTRGQLTALSGVGTVQANRWLAVVELSRRLQQPDDTRQPCITAPADAANLLMPEMRDLQQEQLRVIVLNTRNVVLNVTLIYQGSLNTSVVRIGELFRPAIDKAGAAIIVVHNHPSGDPSPSPEDIHLTRELVKAGKLLNISVLDHIIIGNGRFHSLKGNGLGFEE